MTTVYSISPIQQAMQIGVQAMTSVLNITKQQAMKIDVQAMTTVYSISPIQQAIIIDVLRLIKLFYLPITKNNMHLERN
jgi:hypothetical protein